MNKMVLASVIKWNNIVGMMTGDRLGRGLFKIVKHLFYCLSYILYQFSSSYIFLCEFWE